jgi:hypothetical protein
MRGNNIFGTIAGACVILAVVFLVVAIALTV